MEDEGLCNPPDPKKQNLEKQTKEEDSEHETEEKDNRKLYSLDDLKEIREKIHNYISYWKAFPYRKRTEEPWDFNYKEELNKVLKDDYYHNSLANSKTQDILDEFKLFKDVITELDVDRQAFIKYLNETYDPEWRFYLGKLYKLGLNDVAKKIDEDFSNGKPPDRCYLLGFFDEKSIPTFEKMDLGDTKDDTYEDLAKTLDKLWMGQRCSTHFFREETKLVGIGINVIERMGRILKKKGVHEETKLSTIRASTAAANTHVDCQT